MSVDFFKQKFEPKSNEELEEIAKNNKEYVLEARIAAISIMKSRCFESQSSDSVNRELATLEKIKKIKLENEQLKDKKVTQELENIRNNTTKKIQLEKR